jgi:hypothetical protein
MRFVKWPVPDRPLTVGLAAVLVVFAWQALTVHYNYSGNWTALFCTGSEQRVPPSLAWEGIYVFPGSTGYDGQFYHYQAHDPFLRKGMSEYIDAPRMRSRRFLVPAAAYLLAGGQDRFVDAAMFGILWLSVFLGVFWTSRLLVALGWHAAWGLAFLFVPATFTSIDRMTLDSTLAALTVGFAFYAWAGPSWKLGIVLACAALTRETGTLLLAGYCLYLLVNRRWKRMLLFACAGVPLLTWLWYVETALRGMHRDPGFPYDQPGTIFSTLSYPPPMVLAWTLHILDAFVMAGLLLAVFLAVRGLIRYPRTAEAISSVFFVLLTVAMAVTINLGDPFTYPRPLSPLLLLVALQELKAGSFTGLLPMALVAARPAVQLGPQVLGILRGFWGN